MSTRDVLKYRLVAVIEGQMEYDPETPGTYTTALQYVADKTKALQDLGATVQTRAWPARARDEQ